MATRSHPLVRKRMALVRECEVDIERLGAEIDAISPEIVVLRRHKRELTALMRARDATVGRRADLAERLRGIDAKIEDLESRVITLNNRIHARLEERRRFEREIERGDGV